MEVVVADRSPPSVTCSRCVRPYRPRARALAAPHGDTLDRLRQLTDSAGVTAHGERVTLDPPAAAERIVSCTSRVGVCRD